jgi:hypothetical protein
MKKGRVDRDRTRQREKQTGNMGACVELRLFLVSHLI